MATPPLYRIHTISEYHRLMGHPKPEHPLVSVIDLGSLTDFPFDGPVSFIYDFYCIALKQTPGVTYQYGQYGRQSYDFDDSVLFFMAPKQVFGMEIDRATAERPSGWVLLVHPDLLWNTPLAKTIRHYEYFGYAAHEALHLSEKERKKITGIIRNIRQEYRSNPDRFSQDVIIAQLELLLTYGERFYHRQFLTRKISSHEILDRLDRLLTGYFNSEDLTKSGLPTVQYISEQLNVSQDYLRGLLKTLTGQNTRQHIHEKLIEKAKEQLSTTSLSVGEIAFALGFGHSQSFSKLFKAKTDLSPLAFRQSFN